MSDIRARATDHGTVMLAITDGDGRRAYVELPIEVAERLKAVARGIAPGGSPRSADRTREPRGIG